MSDPILERVRGNVATLRDEMIANRQPVDAMLASAVVQVADSLLVQGKTADELCRDTLSMAMHVIVRTLQAQADAHAAAGGDPGAYLARSVVALGSTFLKTLALMTGGSATVVTAQSEDVHREPVH